MGKIRTRTLGLEDEEKKQKEEQKKRSLDKKMEKKKSKAVEAIIEAEKRDVDEDQVEKVKELKQKKAEEKETKVVKHHVRGKKYKDAKKKVEDTKVYALNEAITLLKKIKYANFDESVELHLNVEKTGLRGEVDLPHSTGKTVRVAVVDDKVLADLDKGVINFDILVTHPSYMPKLAKYAKVLGPKGLMPNPKAGTISPNPEEVVKKFSKGVLRWKTEPKFPLVHQIIGKISHDEKAIEENAWKFMQAVGKANIHEAYIKTTMSPSLQLNIENL